MTSTIQTSGCDSNWILVICASKRNVIPCSITYHLALIFALGEFAVFLGV